MVVSELITEINLESNEILDNEKEYIPYINAAIDHLSMILTAIKDREVIKRKSINNNDVIPVGFMQFVPKQGYPITINNGSFETYGQKEVRDVYYAVKKTHIANMADSIPFTELYTHYLVQLVSYLVKKKSLMIEYAGFDKGFIDSLTQLIQQSRGY
ncbi:hypothetical protein [Veillonella sp. R32]|uniref:hypothetical protein n=1 Tax=Veillonella sp. R32 TaxID=2021312 RepID=UPI0013894D9F|nr:hypothetical protein [Veillonella sp. R32]KAF1680491.1 hypothetical protein VER_08630 [Veillonella sp. R32]